MNRGYDCRNLPESKRQLENRETIGSVQNRCETEVCLNGEEEGLGRRPLESRKLSSESQITEKTLSSSQGRAVGWQQWAVTARGLLCWRRNPAAERAARRAAANRQHQCAAPGGDLGEGGEEGGNGLLLRTALRRIRCFKEGSHNPPRCDKAHE